jgi:hypothetical protein
MRLAGTRVTAVLVSLAIVATACTPPERTAGPSTASTATTATPIPNPPPPAPIALSLRKPGTSSDATVNRTSLLGGLVLAANPIVRTELWAGPDLVEATDLEEPVTELHTTWDWTPGAAGLYGLVFRAIDANGDSATSFPLWIRVRPATTLTGAVIPDAATVGPRGQGSLLLYSPAAAAVEAAAQTASALAPNLVVNEADCTANVILPAVQGADGIALYAATFGSTGFVPLDLLPPQGGQSVVPLGSAPLLVYAESFDAGTTDPGPFAMVVPPSPCAAKGWIGDLLFDEGTLKNTKGADRAYLYISDDGGDLWRRVPAKDQTFIYPDPNGGFDFSGLLPSSAGSMMFEAWGWVNGTLTPLGAGAWEAQGTTAAGAGATAVAPVGAFAGPIIGDSDLDWYVGDDVSTGDPILLRSGTICTYPPQPASTTTAVTVPVSVVGGSSIPQTTSGTANPIALLPNSCTNAPLGGYSTTFRWRPIAGLPTQGLLQVSVLPPPSDPALTFSGLVYSQSIDKGSSDHVDFTVPIPDLIDPPDPQASLPDPEAMTLQLVPGLLGGSGSGETAKAVEIMPPALIQGQQQTKYYVRIIPMDGPALLLGKSNQVVIDIDDTPAPGKLVIPKAPAISVDLQMTPPHLPNPSYEHCVRVIENPFGSKNPAPIDTTGWLNENPDLAKSFAPEIFGSQYLRNFYKTAEQDAFVYEDGLKVHKGLIPGATVCATHLDPPDKDWWDYIVDAVNFIGWVWDMYTTIWDKLQSWVADVLAEVSGCVAIAEAAGKSESDAKALCSSVAKTAIKVTLTAFGVPPTLPKFKDLVEIGKGELTDLIVQKMVDEGILNCGPGQSECEEVAKKLLDKLVDEMQVAATQAAVSGANGNQWLLEIHPGIYVIPEPAGLMSPAIFKITVTRSSNPLTVQPPSTCTFTGYVDGEKADYTWKNYTKKTMQSGPVAGEVMHPKSITMDLSGLQPGESTTGMIVLNSIAEWFPPGQSPVLGGVPVDIDPSTWIFFNPYAGGAYSETNLITTISGQQCGGASQIHPQDSNPTEPWEIPS